jgi:hypothetical protein
MPISPGWRKIQFFTEVILQAQIRNIHQARQKMLIEAGEDSAGLGEHFLVEEISLADTGLVGSQSICQRLGFGGDLGQVFDAQRYQGIMPDCHVFF